MYDDDDEGLDQMIGGVNMANGDNESAVASNDRLDATLLDDYVNVARKTIESCCQIVITAKEDGEIDARTASVILLQFLKLKSGI